MLATKPVSKASASSLPAVDPATVIPKSTESTPVTSTTSSIGTELATIILSPSPCPQPIIHPRIIPVTKSARKPAPAPVIKSKWKSPFHEVIHYTMGPTFHYFNKSFGPDPTICNCTLFPIYSTKRPSPPHFPRCLSDLCLICIKTGFTTACGDKLSPLWTAFQLEEEYQHYRWFYPETIIDKINRARGAEQTLALRVDLREAIRPLMAAFNLEPDSECSGCGGGANGCAECVQKWRKMKSLKELNEERGERAAKVVEEGREEEGEQRGKVLRPALSVMDESSGQEEVRKRKKKKKKGKRATMEASL